MRITVINETVIYKSVQNTPNNPAETGLPLRQSVPDWHLERKKKALSTANI